MRNGTPPFVETCSLAENIIYKGITLDSLIKTAKKRGSDGKTMVIDLIVNTAMTNQLDIVEFRTDMPTVRDAMRLDLDDFRQMIREIQTGAQSVGSSIEAEKSQTGKSQDGSSASSSSEKYLTKLSPFLQRALSEIEDINILFGHVEGNVQSLCSFFAEDFKTCKVSFFSGFYSSDVVFSMMSVHSMLVPP